MVRDICTLDHWEYSIIRHEAEYPPLCGTPALRPSLSKPEAHTSPYSRTDRLRLGFRMRCCLAQSFESPYMRWLCRVPRQAPSCFRRLAGVARARGCCLLYHRVAAPLIWGTCCKGLGLTAVGCAVFSLWLCIAGIPGETRSRGTKRSSKPPGGAIDAANCLRRRTNSRGICRIHGPLRPSLQSFPAGTSSQKRKPFRIVRVQTMDSLTASPPVPSACLLFCSDKK